MGHWRLLFPYAFADRLGYQYLWQTDDDAAVESDVGYNMVNHAREKQLLMMGRAVMNETNSVSAC